MVKTVELKFEDAVHQRLKAIKDAHPKGKLSWHDWVILLADEHEAARSR